MPPVVKFSGNWPERRPNQSPLVAK